jgi:formiminotetrahydrofolate cyclodeaminase
VDEQSAREHAIEAATKHAAEVPLQVALHAAAVAGLAAEVAEHGNVNAASDAGSACALAQACLTSAGLNVRINAASVKDEKAAKAWIADLEKHQATVEKAVQRVNQALEGRAGLPQ